MVLFPCPWLRRVRPVSPSDVARSYQDGHPSATQAEQGKRHGNLASFEDIPPPSQKQLERLSRRLRCRISQESKHAYELGKSVFPVAFKPSKKPFRSASKPATEVAMLGGVGSSLMSERVYDSDAQYITTPKRVAGSGAGSGTGRVIHRIELSDLIERSQEHEESERWAPCQDESNMESQEAAFGLRFIPTPNGSFRGIRGYWQAIRERNSSRALLEPATNRRDDDHRISPARSLPNLNSTSPGFDLPFPDRSQVFDVSRVCDDPGASFDWGQMKRLQQKYGMASSGSLPNLSTDLKAPKPRQPTSSGTSHGVPGSLYLGHMGISHQLASQAVSSVAFSDNLPMTEFLGKKRHKCFVPLSSESFQRCRLSGTPNLPGVKVRKTRQDASLCDSQETNFPRSTNMSPRLQSSSLNSPISDVEQLEDAPEVAEMTAGLNLTSDGLAASIVLPRGKFREHCDIGSAELGPTDPTEVIRPRKVSIGWMSGGRRVGYGYTPVPNAGEPQNQDADILEHTHMKEQMSTKHHDEFDSGEPPSNHHMLKETAYQEPHPVLVPRHSKHRNLTPVTLPQIKPAAQTVETDSMPPSLQAIFGRRRHRSNQDDETGAIWIDEGIAGDFDTPEISPVLPAELPKPQGGAFTSVLSAERWAMISQSANVQVQTHSKETPRKSSHGEIVDVATDTPDPSDGKSVNESEGPAGQSRRMPKWPAIFSKRGESRRHSPVHQPETSDASSAVYLDCDANSLSRANSTKSVGTEDLAAKYRERMQMPGSFDGSRWASRSSRMLWDLCTTDDY